MNTCIAVIDLHPSSDPPRKGSKRCIGAETQRGCTDERWLLLLMQEAGGPASFVLEGIGPLGPRLGVRLDAILEREREAAHRAGRDAEALLLGALEPGRSGAGAIGLARRGSTGSSRSTHA